jgi:hypothetical protein
MAKTLHTKLTDKRIYSAPAALLPANTIYGDFCGEMQLLKEAATDLLKPRPQAIANLLKMAKAL